MRRVQRGGVGRDKAACQGEIPVRGEFVVIGEKVRKKRKLVRWFGVELVKESRSRSWLVVRGEVREK